MDQSPSTATSGKQRKVRVDWTDEELIQVADAVASIYLTNPAHTVTALLEQAQLGLPVDRRRVLTNWASNHRLLTSVTQKLAEVAAVYYQVKTIGVSNLASKLQETNDELEELRTAVKGAASLHEQLVNVNARLERATVIEQENAAVLAEITEAKKTLTAAQVKIEQLEMDLATARALPTERLVTELLGRAAGAIQGERERLNELIGNRVDSLRHDIENRLYRLEQRAVSRTEHLPIAPAPVVTASEYMPRFIIAGAERTDFQRLQHQVSKLRIIFNKLDTSKPNAIRALGQHDRFIIWKGKGRIPADMATSLMSYSKNAIIHDGGREELVLLIQAEAARIRDELSAKKTAGTVAMATVNGATS